VRYPSTSRRRAMAKATKKTGRGTARNVRDLAVKSKAGRSVKGGGTKVTPPPAPTPKGGAIEISDYGFGVSMPVTTS